MAKGCWSESFRFREAGGVAGRIALLALALCGSAPALVAAERFAAPEAGGGGGLEPAGRLELFSGRDRVELVSDLLPWDPDAAIERPSEGELDVESEGFESPPGPLRQIGVDLVALVRAPADFDRRDWGRVALAAAAVGAVSRFDDRVREEIRSDGAGSATFAQRIRPLGQEGGLALMALAWSYGRVSGRPKLAAIGQDGIEATVLASGIVVPALKQLVGRSRPRSGLGSRSFSGSESFPSGETAEAFAIASVVAAHSESRTVDTLAYATASLIGWQRIRLDAHWASDVVAGAILGTTIGRFVVRRNHPEALDAPSFQLAPLIGEKSWGLDLRWSF